MDGNIKSGKMWVGITKRISVSVLLGFVVAVLGAIVITMLVANETIPIEGSGLACLAVNFLSALAGSMSLTLISKDRIIMQCAIFAAVFGILNICIGVLVYNAISATAWIGLCCMIAASFISCLISIKIKRNTVVRKRHYR